MIAAGWNLPHYDEWLTEEPDASESYEEMCAREDSWLEQAEARAEREEDER
jgi:hypothetical protein